MYMNNTIMRTILTVAFFILMSMTQVIAQSLDYTIRVNESSIPGRDTVDSKKEMVIDKYQDSLFCENTIKKLGKEIDSLNQCIHDLKVLWAVTREIDNHGLFNLPELPPEKAETSEISDTNLSKEGSLADNKSSGWHGFVNWLGGLFGCSKSNKLENQGTQNGCEAEIQQLSDRLAGLRTELADIRYLLNPVVETDNLDFFERLIMDPLGKMYDSALVERHKQAIAQINFDDKEKMKERYNWCYPLLENYGKYNNEMAGFVLTVVRSFEQSARFDKIPNIMREKEGYLVFSYNQSEYKKVRKNKHSRQKIDYLDMVHESTLSLFDDPSKFTKENFVEQLKKLGKEYGNK